MKKFIRSMKNAANKVTNFMGGVSYKLNPIDTLKMITASSIFGEPAYYRDGELSPKTLRDSIFEVNALFAPYSITSDEYLGKKTSEIMEIVIDEALNFDYEATIRWAEVLRRDYLMRLNPQVIMVRTASHPNRREFTDKNQGEFNRLNQSVMARADEPATQLAYWLFRNKTKNRIPAILKRSWAKRLSSCTRYELFKYRNAGLGMIDTVRVCHAKGSNIDELMKTGTVAVQDDSATWEKLRSEGHSWLEITKRLDLPHMALLRNLRGIFEETDDASFCAALMSRLKDGVKKGKQFPFRYWSALKAVENSEARHKTTIMNTLEECVDIATEELPRLRGKTMCL
ncbi:MAG: TROVE domain-containing protein, partial [Synergistaceae bacterium]|nr:TROVE domain-containing protein [Synergistaceae bacterium]